MSDAAPLQNTFAKAEHSILSVGGRLLQRKLVIGASNDPLEQEADRVADQVLAMPEHNEINSTPPITQRFTGQQIGTLEETPTSVERVLANPGRPLNPVLRQDMERRFRHDFGQVRVHTDSIAEQSAREVSANAFTAGNNIVFGTDQYTLENRQGRQLIAHELVHVVQQSFSEKIDEVKGEPNSSSAKSLQRDFNKFTLTRDDQKAAQAAFNAMNLLNLNPTGEPNSPCIWFDDWAKDQRDNNRFDSSGNKKTEILIDANDPEELETLSADGIHIKDLRPSTICEGDPVKRIDEPGCNEKKVYAKYYVCIDIPKLAYKQAGVDFPGGRSVCNTVDTLKRNRLNWMTIRDKDTAKQGSPLAGDFLADCYGGHGHSAIALNASSAVNIPGPSRLFNEPSSKNDIMKCPTKFDYVFRPAKIERKP